MLKKKNRFVLETFALSSHEVCHLHQLIYLYAWSMARSISSSIGMTLINVASFLMFFQFSFLSLSDFLFFSNESWQTGRPRPCLIHKAYLSHPKCNSLLLDYFCPPGFWWSSTLDYRTPEVPLFSTPSYSFWQLWCGCWSFSGISKPFSLGYENCLQHCRILYHLWCPSWASLSVMGEKFIDKVLYPYGPLALHF